MPSTVTRRKFLKSSIGATSLALVNLELSGLASASNLLSPTKAVESAAQLQYQNFADIYRKKWTWDSVAKGTHFVNCAYQRGCAWNVYVKDGMVWREEQVGKYEQINPEVPDFNPRGCQKGACYSDRMYDASRLTHPLKRVGERGEGKWKQVTWDEALTDIADRTIDAMVAEEDGPGSIYWDLGTAVTNGCHGVGLIRTGHVLDTPVLETNTEIGDQYPGVSTTLGKIVFNSSMDDLHYADLILIWGGNPNYTHIPNAHFINEARYKGAHIVTITPDYNASAIHADEWITVKVGSDAALGLAMAQVMIEEKIYNHDFVIEQTDMPLLVRSDNGEFLRERDFSRGGDDDLFYIYDINAAEVAEAPRRDLKLGDMLPALEGKYVVDTLQGKIEVEPVFERLKTQLIDYTPESTEAITGVKPTVARNLARRMAKARACSNITQTNFSKFYHGMEMERAMLLVFALAGQFGKKGAGFSAFPHLSVAGIDSFNVSSGSLSPKVGMLAMAAKMAPQMIKMKLKGYTMEMILYEIARQDYAKGNVLATPLFLYEHGGLKELYGSAARWDPHLKRDFSEFYDEAVEKGWQHPPKGKPRIFFEVGGNFFRRVRGYHKVMEHMLPKLDLLVTLDWRMSNTARYSDYVLPAAGWYEKDDITWGSAAVPYSHVTTQAVKPLGQSKTDWEFHCLLLKKMQQRAKSRGLTTFLDRIGEERRLDKVYDEFTFNGRFHEDNADEFLDEMLSVTTNLNGEGWEELKEKGFARFTDLGISVQQIGNATDIEPDETIVSNAWHVQKKQPWPTLTRRMQFFIDHPFFKEVGETLPVHKDNPAMGGDYPLQMIAGHNRWSIHAMWRDHEPLSRLHRGEPVIYVSIDDAKRRKVVDGEMVKVYNDIGDFEVQAKVSPTLAAGQVLMYHAWEPYQFKDEKTHQSLIPSPMNPVHLAGGYFHLQPMILMQSPGCPDRGTRVEFERVGERV